MQFITTDQRIAVENFEIGLIYTVTFTRGSYFLGACIGIGKDYVMFQRTEPELIYCLIMATAADVASIEPLSDDIGKILEYTGSVPVSIKTDGSPILDYLITGNTIQNGTPSPSAPVDVQGVGELDSGQYKIPISSAGQTTPVYLGEVETTRRIKKLVFDGTENWRFDGTTYYINISSMTEPVIPNSPLYCSHFVNSSQGMRNGTNWAFVTKYETATTASDWKSYLAAQYSAGTPVTVWYILASETTGIINEPLMRIGDYADTLSKAQAGVSVPTNNGSTTVDVDTTVKPSEVYIKYFSPIF